MVSKSDFWSNYYLFENEAKSAFIGMKEFTWSNVCGRMFINLTFRYPVLGASPKRWLISCLQKWKIIFHQRWSRGHKARGQGQGHKKIRGQGQGQPFRGQTLLRPRTGMLEAKAKAKDSLSEDRHSCGQGQECSRPRPRTKDTSASALQKKRFSQEFFRRSPKKGLHKNFSSDLHKKTFSKKFLKRSKKF